MGKQGILLENRVDVPLVRRQTVDALAVKNDVAAFRLQKSADDPQRGGFAAAAGTEDRHKFLFADVQVDMIEDNFAVKAEENVL